MRAEVTARMLIAGPWHLRAVLEEYAKHCNHHRPHRARNLHLPDRADMTPAAIADLTAARIRRHKEQWGHSRVLRPQHDRHQLSHDVAGQDHDTVMEPARRAVDITARIRAQVLGGLICEYRRVA